MKPDVWDEIESLERRLDDGLHWLLGTRARLAQPVLPLFLRRPCVPTMDVCAREGDLVVRVELPGIDPKRDVTIEVEDRDLVVRGERRRQEDAEDNAYYRLEAPCGAFERRVSLPDGVDESGITASFEAGVLEIVVPKPEAKDHSKVRKISIVQGGAR